MSFLRDILQLNEFTSYPSVSVFNLNQNFSRAVLLLLMQIYSQQPESTWNPVEVTKPVTQNLPKPEKIEIFRDHMIEQFYLDLAEEKNYTIIYGKSF